MSVDFVTSIALLSLLCLLLQMEHERCDRVRAGWREVRRATFSATSAIQLATKSHDHPNFEEYALAARKSVQELHSTILLYGKGPLREEYRKNLLESLKAGHPLTKLLPIFQNLDGDTEKKFVVWRLTRL
jgi:hypothetical protein